MIYADGKTPVKDVVVVVKTCPQYRKGFSFCLTVTLFNICNDPYDIGRHVPLSCF